MRSPVYNEPPPFTARAGTKAGAGLDPAPARPTATPARGVNPGGSWQYGLSAAEGQWRQPAAEKQPGPRLGHGLRFHVQAELVGKDPSAAPPITPLKSDVHLHDLLPEERLVDRLDVESRMAGRMRLLYSRRPGLSLPKRVGPANLFAITHDEPPPFTARVGTKAGAGLDPAPARPTATPARGVNPGGSWQYVLPTIWIFPAGQRFALASYDIVHSSVHALRRPQPADTPSAGPATPAGGIQLP